MLGAHFVWRPLAASSTSGAVTARCSPASSPRPKAGGVMSYGPNQLVMYRGLVPYISKILKGAKPGDLPIPQPTHFELVVNLKVVKALGLTVPPSLVLRANQVIG
jgi:ABC-type uncharacterized transport system substrate-binding protein